MWGNDRHNLHCMDCGGDLGTDDISATRHDPEGNTYCPGCRYDYCFECGLIPVPDDKDLCPQCDLEAESTTDT